MRKTIIIFSSLLIIVSSCKRHLTYDQTGAELKNAMGEYLNSRKNIDTNKLKFTVVNVIFYEDKTVFDCQFKVEMKEPNRDTVGEMAAWISKDFSIVKRK